MARRKAIVRAETFRMNRWHDVSRRFHCAVARLRHAIRFGAHTSGAGARPSVAAALAGTICPLEWLGLALAFLVDLPADPAGREAAGVDVDVGHAGPDHVDQ